MEFSEAWKQLGEQRRRMEASSDRTTSMSSSSNRSSAHRTEGNNAVIPPTRLMSPVHPARQAKQNIELLYPAATDSNEEAAYPNLRRQTDFTSLLPPSASSAWGPDNKRLTTTSTVTASNNIALFDRGHASDFLHRSHLTLFGKDRASTLLVDTPSTTELLIRQAHLFSPSRYGEPARQERAPEVRKEVPLNPSRANERTATHNDRTSGGTVEEPEVKYSSRPIPRQTKVVSGLNASQSPDPERPAPQGFVRGPGNDEATLEQPPTQQVVQPTRHATVVLPPAQDKPELPTLKPLPQDTNAGGQPQEQMPIAKARETRSRGFFDVLGVLENIESNRRRNLETEEMQRHSDLMYLWTRHWFGKECLAHSAARYAIPPAVPPRYRVPSLVSTSQNQRPAPKQPENVDRKKTSAAAQAPEHRNSAPVGATNGAAQTFAERPNPAARVQADTVGLPEEQLDVPSDEAAWKPAAVGRPYRRQVKEPKTQFSLQPQQSDLEAASQANPVATGETSTAPATSSALAEASAAPRQQQSEPEGPVQKPKQSEPDKPPSAPQLQYKEEKASEETAMPKLAAGDQSEVTVHPPAPPRHDIYDRDGSKTPEEGVDSGLGPRLKGMKTPSAQSTPAKATPTQTPPVQVSPRPQGDILWYPPLPQQPNSFQVTAGPEQSHQQQVAPPPYIPSHLSPPPYHSSQAGYYGGGYPMRSAPPQYFMGGPMQQGVHHPELYVAQPKPNRSPGLRIYAPIN